MMVNNHGLTAAQTDWQKSLEAIFNYGIAERYQWDNYEDILQVLQTVSPASNNLRLFYPLGGAIEIHKISAAKEQGFIELHTGLKTNFFDLLKPALLEFEGFTDHLDWSYFRLYAAPIEQSPKNPNKCYITEHLIELPNGEYIPSYHAETGEYNGEILTPPFKKVNRHLEGDFLICPVHSPYNQNKPTYDGRHRGMDSDVLRHSITHQIEYSIANN